MMQGTFLLRIGCAAAACLLAMGSAGRVAGADNAAVAGEIVAICRTDVPAAIDGVMNEPFWTNAPDVRADYADGTPGVPGAPRMRVRFAWDANYLYIGYETFDTNLTAKGSGAREGSEGNRREGAVIWAPPDRIDVVEFFVSFNDPVFFWEFHHNALNCWNDTWCVVPPESWPLASSSALDYGIRFARHEYIEDDGPATWAAAVALKPKADGRPSTIDDSRDVDTGYTAEIRLPWKALGAPTAARKTATPNGWDLTGVTIRVLAMAQDGDLPVRYHHSSPTRTGGWPHKGYADWPIYRFVERTGSGDGEVKP
jgi:hypothetical protein